MYLTIWRHGEAGSAVTDRKRELTNQGTDDIGFGCHQFHNLCEQRGLPHPDLILYSEWIRAAQSADILASAFSHAALEQCDALIPGRRPADVDTALELRLAQKAPDHMVLVSHQPLVSVLVDHYLADAGKVPPLVPGGLATLELEMIGAGCATLVFCAQPPEFEAWV